MNHKPEHTADITAEIRARAGAWSEPALTKYDMTLADRIDAAVKRECIEAATRAATQGVKLTNEKYANMPIGNTAAMHDALLKAIVLLRACDWPDDTPMQAVAEVIDEIEKASSAPPRNCDMYGGDYRMLHTAWFDWTGSPSGRNPDGTIKLTFSEWLLEKAVRHDI